MLYKKDNSFVSSCFLTIGTIYLRRRYFLGGGVKKSWKFDDLLNGYIMNSSYQFMKSSNCCPLNQSKWKILIKYFLRNTFEVSNFFVLQQTMHIKYMHVLLVCQELLIFARAYFRMTVAREFNHYFNQSQKKSVCFNKSAILWLVEKGTI